MYLFMIPWVRRMHVHISLNVFEFARFPDKMQVESFKNMLFLLREYNESVWA